MNEREKYLFDLQGYLVVEDVLTKDECQMAKAKMRDRMKPREKTPDGYDAQGTWFSAHRLLESGEPSTTTITSRGLTVWFATLASARAMVAAAP